MRKTQRHARTTRPPNGHPIGTTESIAERQQQAMELRKAGGSFRAIGRQIGVDASTAYRYVQTALKELRALRDADAEEYRQLELERLDGLLLAVMPKARTGDVQSVESARKLSESRRKLLGIDAAEKWELAGKDGGPVQVSKIERVILDGSEQNATT